MLLLGLVGCGSSAGVSPPASERGSAATTDAGSSSSGRSTGEVRLEARLRAPAPHQSVIAVVDVVQIPSSRVGERGFAVLLRGDVGLSAVIRSLQLSAWMEVIDGSTCGTPPVPTVLHPAHEDAMQPALADQTRVAVVRSRGIAAPSVGSRTQASFRYGPVPSLNGVFEGWVSFAIPAHSDVGFCAFDVRGLVTVVAGETTSAELPVVRIDTRHRLDGDRGRFDAPTAN